MCLIIRKPVGREISSEFLAEVWKKNHDGFGWCFADENVVRWNRGMNLEDAIQEIARIPLQREAFIHMRQATKGEIVHDLAHPFEVLPDLVLMHNGTLDIPIEDVKMSDTWQLAQFLRKKLFQYSKEVLDEVIRHPDFVRMLNGIVKTSAVVLLSSKGPAFYGRVWHTLTAEDWPELQGVEVSNTTTWAPKPCSL